ncbi:FAD-dependent oxidoreductase [Acidisoma sp. S159]|uniref:FAD-dependent oxidoreductase n=1 Tax=Acidisoma sp. S159 TaxID=1747225 RepID=UPI00131D505E|nr:FAD-dependent oxidoreductase [Acidisoma sp. S159]
METFDVAVVGGGITGASAANHLISLGFSTVLLDRGDIGGATSGRTSRLQYCGLSYFSTIQSLGKIAAHPVESLEGVAMARRAMKNRSEFVRSNPERVRAVTFHFPLYKEDTFPLWQVRAGFSLLQRLDPRGVPLDIVQITPDQARRHPMLSRMRDLDRLAGVLQYTEYQFDWPERIVADAALNAEELGARILNYTLVAGITQNADKSWMLDCLDRRSGERRSLRARALVNTAGVWVDQLAASSKLGLPRLNQGAKGVNIMFRLPDAFRGLGFETMTRGGEPFYVIPWDDLHYIGPRNKPHDGGPDGFLVEEQEIADLLDEMNYQFPSLNLKRRDLRYAWAGVRPRTAHRHEAAGGHISMLHDMSGQGAPNYYCYTGGLLMTHRTAGRTIARAVAKRTKPSRPAQPEQLVARAFPRADNSSPLPGAYRDLRWGDLRHAAAHEHVHTFDDLMFRRVRLGWTERMGADIAHDVAAEVRDVLGWSPEEANARANAYINDLRTTFHFVEP